MNRKPAALFAWWALGLMAAMVFGGCELEASLNHEHIDKGLVVVLPGIDGPGLGTGGVMQAVADSTDLAVTQFDWTIPFAMMLNQTLRNTWADLAKIPEDEYTSELVDKVLMTHDTGVRKTQKPVDYAFTLARRYPVDIVQDDRHRPVLDDLPDPFQLDIRVLRIRT